MNQRPVRCFWFGFGLVLGYVHFVSLAEAVVHGVIGFASARLAWWIVDRVFPETEVRRP